MTDDVELEIPPHAAFLDVVRTVIATTAGIDPLLPEQRVADLRLAVSEACANAIHAHQRAHTTEMVQVRCSVDDKRVTVEIQDHGEGSTPRPSRRSPPPPTPPASSTSAASGSRSCGPSPTRSTSGPSTTARSSRWSSTSQRSERGQSPSA